MVKLLTFFLILSSAAVAATNSDSKLNQEIEEQVILPCLQSILTKPQFSSLSEVIEDKEDIKLLASLPGTQEGMEKMRKEVREQAKDLPQDKRPRLYKIMRGICKKQASDTDLFLQ